jgi:hypothetical protein
MGTRYPALWLFRIGPEMEYAADPKITGLYYQLGGTAGGWLWIYLPPMKKTGLTAAARILAGKELNTFTTSTTVFITWPGRAFLMEATNGLTPALR